MPRKRKPENEGFPTGWAYEHGAFYFYVPKGMEERWDHKRKFRLGKTAPEAYRVWADRIELASTSVQSFNQLFDEYLIRVTPAKAKASQASDRANIAAVRPVFGKMPITAFEPHHAYKYVDTRRNARDGQPAPHAGRREMAILSAALSSAVEWGRIKSNPLIKAFRKGVPHKPKTYVTDEQLAEVIAKASPFMAAYLRLKVQTGLRKTDMLRMTLDWIRDDGIHIVPQKTIKATGKALWFKMTPDLKSAIDAAMEVHDKRAPKSPILFCTLNGGSYIDDDGRTPTFNTNWRNMMLGQKTKTGHTPPRFPFYFTEHDIRRKTGSDSGSVAAAQHRLGHASPRVTMAHYRVKEDEVEPLPWPSESRNPDDSRKPE